VIQTKEFRKHYVIFAMILVAFVALGMMANLAIFRIVEKAAHDRQPKFAPESSIGRMVDAMADAIGKGPRERNRFEALRKIREANGDGFPLEMRLVDASGTSLEVPGLAPPARWNEKNLPARPYELVALMSSPDSGPPLESAVRLPGPQGQFLYLRRKNPPPPAPTPPFRGWPFPAGPAFLSLATLLASILMGAAVSLWILFRSLRSKAELADRVIAELQAGNLKARFPIDRIDEMSQTMTRFNRMAEEIERLVDQLRESERTRTNLLQELAHDLRTPVASLKSLLETLEAKGSTLGKGIHDELTALAVKEVDYFERLVEDLLVLARIGAPQYRYAKDPFDLRELVEEEIDSILSRRAMTEGAKVRIEFADGEEALVVGDTHLLRRMIRNALENAYDFSRERLVVSLRKRKDGPTELEIQDDGPGFNEEQLKNFGTRRITRQLGSERGGRISIGLGSVIMRTIAEIHRGQMMAKNTERGAKVVFELPPSAG
jgi:signal transduction histidine kinase